MAHLYSAELEQKLIVCALETRSPRIRATILSETDEDLYGSEYGQLARKRMNALLRAGKQFGTALDFAEDAAISSSKGAVAFIKATSDKRKAAAKFDLERVLQLTEQLKRYQQVRTVYSTQQTVNDIAAGNVGENEIERVRGAWEKGLGDLQASTGRQELLHFGSRSSDEEARREFAELMVYNPGQFVSTGLEWLDQHLHGFERGNLVTLSAPRAGGKSAMAMSMAINQYLRSNHNVCYVSIEMTKKEFMRRVVSNISKVPHDKVRVTKYMTKEERKQAGAAFKQWQRHGKNNNCCFTVWPVRDTAFTPYKIETRLAPLMYDVIVIDYITLMHAQGMDTWKMQMEYSRYLAMMAKKLNCVIVLLSQLSDDERVKYGKCVAEGSRVWGTGTEIENVTPGMALTTLHKNQATAWTTATKLFVNGNHPVLKIRTKHRIVTVTPNHHILVQSHLGSREWKRARELRCHRKPSGKLNYDKTDKIVISTRMPKGHRVTWEEVVNLERVNRTKRGEKGTPHKLQLPKTVTPWFCRLYGFLLGDGWIVDQPSNRSTCFARGVEEETNQRYERYLQKLGMRTSTHHAKDGSNSSHTQASSIRLVQLLKELGWKNGATVKRIPNWAYSLPDEHREAFLDGFMDADGWCSQPATWKRTAYHFEIANEDLARDLKTLIDGLGYIAGNIRKRTRPAGIKINGHVVKSVQPSYTLTFSRKKFDGDSYAEAVLEITSTGATNVYDVQVDDEAHNYIVDGVVVHNSIEENTDYWIWWPYGPEEEESGNVDIRLGKARHARPGRFPSRFMLDIMRIETAAIQGRDGGKRSGAISADSGIWTNSES